MKWVESKPEPRVSGKEVAPMDAKHVSLFVFFGLLTACGAAPAALDASSGADASAESPPDLAGHWVSACTPSPQADGTTQYIQLDFELTSSRWDLEYVTYADDACSTPLVSVHVDGPYELTRPSAVDGAWEARFAFDHKSITPHVDPITGFLNAQESCGAAEWQTGVAQEVLETGCAAFGQYPRSRCEADYDLVARDGSTHRFGARPADNDMCSEERRPSELSPLAHELR